MVLLDESVARSGQNIDECTAVKWQNRGDDGQSADELGNQSELVQIFGLYFGKQVLLFTLELKGCTEPDTVATDALRHDFVEPRERTGDDEQNIRRVDLEEFLVGVLSTALGRNARNGSLKNLEKSLLNTFARYVAGD